jgi:hypothetical protein
MSFGNAMGYVGLGGIVIGISGYLSYGATTLWDTWVAASSLTMGTGMVVFYIAKHKAKHYAQRIEYLSFIVVPNKLLIGQNDYNLNNLNLGIRFNF